MCSQQNENSTPMVKCMVVVYELKLITPVSNCDFRSIGKANGLKNMI